MLMPLLLGSTLGIMFQNQKGIGLVMVLHIELPA